MTNANSELSGVVDTGEKFLTGVNDAGNVLFVGVVNTGEAPKYSNFSANKIKN